MLWNWTVDSRHLQDEYKRREHVRKFVEAATLHAKSILGQRRRKSSQQAKLRIMLFIGVT